MMNRTNVPRAALIGGAAVAVALAALLAWLLVGGQGELSRNLEATAGQIRAQLPIQADAVTTIRDVTVDGVTMTYHYEMAGTGADYEGVSVEEDLGPALLANACGNADTARILAEGGRFVFDYEAADGTEIGGYAVAQADCPAT